MASKNDSSANQTSSVSERLASHARPSSPLTISSCISQTSDDARGELTAQLEDLLNTLSNKFAGVSSEIFAKSK